MTITVVPFEPRMRESWDELCARAANRHFFYSRGYLEYHGARFTDASLMFLERGRALAVLPAARDGDGVASHPGLSFAGLVADARADSLRIVECVERMVERLREDGVRRLVYRAAPRIYRHPEGEADLYALTRLGARLVQRELSSVLALGAPAAYATRKRRNLAKAHAAGLRVAHSDRLDAFHALLSDVLRERHGVSPVHSLETLGALMRAFPDRIRLFTCTGEDAELLAGTVVFDTGRVAHLQYLASSESGRRVAALDCLIDWLIGTPFRDHAYLSFGLSSEPATGRLNSGLLRSKEEFGARGLVHDVYDLAIGAAHGDG